MALDWPGYQQDRPVAKAGLPTYPFQRERYWVDPPATALPRPAATLGAPSPAAAQGAGTGAAPGAAKSTAEPHVRLLTPRWTPADTPEASTTGTPEALARCVLLGGRAQAAETLARTLRAHGLEVVTVAPSDTSAEAPGGLAETSGGGRTVLVDLRLLDEEDPSAGAHDGLLSTGPAARRLGRGR